MALQIPFMTRLLLFSKAKWPTTIKVIKTNFKLSKYASLFCSNLGVKVVVIERD